MTRKLGDWGLPATVAALHRVAHDDRGVRNAALVATETALTDHPAVRRRCREGVGARQALIKAVDELGRYGTGSGRIEWTVEENEAIKALLWLSNSVDCAGREYVLNDVAKNRAEIACRLLHATSESQFRRPRSPGRRRTRPDVRTGPLWSDETDLLTRFVAALDVLDAVPSHTQDVGRTAPPARSAEPPVGIHDLVGTWLGETESAWPLKDDQVGGAGTVPCFMVVEEAEGSVLLRWFYRAGTSVGVAVRVAPMSRGRRIVCVYEADLPHTTLWRAPSHRGTCILDVSPVADSTDGTATTAVSVIGPYWTDRQTQGMLRFLRRVDDIALDFVSAAALFDRED